MDGKGEFLAGVIVGSVVGTVVGILFAPASGQETRTRIADKGKEVKDQALYTAKEKAEAVTESSRELIDKLKEKLPQTKEVQDVLSNAEKDINS